MAKKKSPTKITIELELTGHPVLKKAFEDIQKQVDKFHKIQKKLTGGTKKGTQAQKKFAKTIVDTQRKIRNLGNEVKKTGDANDKLAAKFSVFRSKLLLASFGASLFVGNLVRLANAAGNVEEDMNKANVVFGDSAAVVQAFAKDMEREMGKSRHEVVRFAASVQDILVPLGLLRGFAANVSQEVVKLAIDVASFNNALDADVMRDFNSAIVGNHETVRKYGIVISEARLKQVAFSEGIIEAGQTLTDQQKILARIAILQKDSADAADDAKETFFSFNNQMKALNTEIENTRIVIGQMLMPVIKTFAIAIRLLLKLIQNFTGVFILAAFHAAKFGLEIVKAKLGIKTFGDATAIASKKLNKFGAAILKNLAFLAAFEVAVRLARVSYNFLTDAPDLEKVGQSFVSVDKELAKLIASAKQFSQTKILADFESLNFAVDAFEQLDEALKSDDREQAIKGVVGSMQGMHKGLEILSESGEKLTLQFRNGDITFLKNGEVIASTTDNYKEFIATLLGVGQRLKETRDSYGDLASFQEDAFAKSMNKAQEGLAKLDSQIYRSRTFGKITEVWSSAIQEQMLKNVTSFNLFGKNYDEMVSTLEKNIELAQIGGDPKVIEDAKIKLDEFKGVIDETVSKQSELDINKMMMDLNAEIKANVDAQNAYNISLKDGSDIALDDLKFFKLKNELAKKNVFIQNEELLLLIQRQEELETEKKTIEDIIAKHKMLEESLEKQVIARELSNEIAIMLLDSEAQGSIASRKANLETIEFLKFSNQMKQQNAQLTDKEIEKLYEKNQAEKDAENNLKILQASQDYMISTTKELDLQIGLLKAQDEFTKQSLKAQKEGLVLSNEDIQLIIDKTKELQRLEDIQSLVNDLQNDKSKIEVLQEELALLRTLNAEEILRIGGITVYLSYVKQLEDSIQNLKDLRIADVLKLEGELKDIQSPSITPPEQFDASYISGNLFQTLIGGDETSFTGEIKAIQDSYSNAMSYFATEEARLSGLIASFGEDNNALSDEQLAKKEQYLKDLIALEEEEVEFIKTMEEQKQEIRNKTFEMAKETFSMFVDMRKENLQREMGDELDALKQSEKYRVASDKRKQKLEEEVKKKYAKEQLKIFKLDQASKLASVAMNTAEGIVKAAAAFPTAVPPGAPWSIMIGAMGAMQAGMILAQKPPKYQYGGLVGGALHSSGGTLIEAERGEFVMNRNATEAIGLEQLNRMNRTGQSGNNINITLTGNVLSDDFVADEFIPKLEERLQVLSDGTITDRFS